MNGEERDSGIDLLGHILWGTHFCQFYDTPEDLTSTLVPYFKAGLENNEFCMWVTAEPLGKESALAAMRRAMPDFDLYLGRGQIEVVPHDQWYLRDGIFNQQKVLERWIDKLDHALKQGYDGLRLTGNTFWLEKHDWKRFTAYEEEINKVIGKYRMMAICTYSLNRCSAAEVIDVVNNHQFAIIRRQGQWQRMESARHKQMEEALRKAEGEEYFHHSMDESPLGIRIVTPEGKTVYANRAIRDIYGCGSFEELETTPIKERYTPKSYAEHHVRKEKRKRGDYVPPNYEISIVRKDGEIRHLEVLRKEVPWHGKTHFQVLYQDITERKRAEEALLIIKRAVESASDAIGISDPQGHHFYNNKSFTNLFEYTAEELEAAGGGPVAFSSGDTAREVFDAILNGRSWSGETEAISKSGRRFPVFLRADAVKDDVGRIISVLGTFTDITERKQAEEELKRREELLNNIIEQTPNALWISDNKGIVIRMNQALRDLLKITDEEIIGKYSVLADTQVIEQGFAPLIKSVFEEGKTVNFIIDYDTAKEKQTTLAQTTHNVLDLVVSAIKNREGKVVNAICQHKDITEQEKAKAALRESEQRYRTLFETTGTATMLIEEDMTISLVNAEQEKISGYSREEVEGKRKWTEFVVKEDLDRLRKYHRLRRTDPKAAPRQYECRIIDKWGHAKHLLMTVDMIPGTMRSIASFVNITERRRVEDERARSDKLESVGTLAGGIAHDFNNLLTGILGNIDLAKRYSEAGEMSRASATLSEAERASLRAKDLTHQLLTFAKGGLPIKKLASITELAKETATFALSGSNVKCQFDLPDDILAVECDEGQIGQVISNIVINADHAMPKGGTLKVSARNTVIGTGGTLPLPKGNYVEIIIADHGIGISREHLDRIFDPYFTTKHKGSGLGLATSYSIIRNHGGHIRVESELGVGTTFYVYLPASKKPVRKIGEKQALRSSLITQGKILVMDDEEIIRRMLSDMLGIFGYKATLAKDGDEAIERYTEAKNSGQPFDAVILDLTIPGGMGGGEAIKKLIAIDPGVKAIVSSGYATDPLMADYKKHGFSAVVTKPYSAGDLERTLRSILKPKK